MLKILPKSIITALSSLFLSTRIVLAHGGDGGEEIVSVAENTLEDIIRTNSIIIVVISSILVLGFVALTILLKHQGENLKKLLFAGIVVPTLITTVFLAGSTIYINVVSSSGGPVHWHAGLEIWDCGKKLNLVDPEGFSGKVGSSAFHEHNDDQLHIEGVINKPQEAGLGKFFQFIGGELNDDGFEIPTNNGLMVRNNGDLCPDGSIGNLQVFGYKTNNKVFTQEKLPNPSLYILSPEGSVPPGDCIIVEFGEKKEKTDKLCNGYKLQILKGNLYGN